MKNLKKILTSLFLALFLISFVSCSDDDCSGDNPRARVNNNGTSEVSIQIKTTGGNTENINNVAAGTSTEYRSFEEGEITFTITVGSSEVIEVVDMSTCTEYQVSIDESNVVTTTTMSL